MSVTITVPNDSDSRLRGASFAPAAGLVAITRPNFTVTATPTTTYSYFADGRGAVQFGDIDLPNTTNAKGITFQYAAPGSVPLNSLTQWVQLTDLDTHYDKMDDGVLRRYMLVSPGFVLDNSYPYNPEKGYNPTSDSPGNGFSLGSYFNRHDDFKMYLMWVWDSRSLPGVDGIFIPLNITVWHWGFTAGPDGSGVWAANADADNGPTSGPMDTTQFPEWSDNVKYYNDPTNPQHED